MSEAFYLPVRVYYEDTDAGGVVYHANYLNFMERARTEYLRHHGFEQDTLRNELGVLFVVKSINIDYRRPARFNDHLHVTAEVTASGRSSMTFSQQVIASDGSVVFSSAEVVVVCVDAHTIRPCSIPKEVKERAL